MRTITFKEFWTEYREYFHITEKRMVIRTREELEDVIYFFYETEHFEFNYENNTIELY